MTQQNVWVTTYLPLISTLVVAIATVVLVCLTSRYVRLTRSMLEETQKAREPAVTLDFEKMPDETIHLVVENHGLSPARNVQITVLKGAQLFKELQGFADNWPLNGILYLTPLRKLKYYLGYLNLENITEEQMITTFRIIYENEVEKKYEHIVNFDFRQMLGALSESFGDSSQKVAEALQSIERQNKQIHRTRSFF